MEKISLAIPLVLLLLVVAGCSSAPEGTISLKDLQQTIEQRIGEKVVAVGTVDTSTAGMSTTGLFRLYKGNDFIWARVPDGESAPPQGVRVRVTGVVTENEFSGGIGRKVYIDSESVRME